MKAGTTAVMAADGKGLLRRWACAALAAGLMGLPVMAEEAPAEKEPPAEEEAAGKKPAGKDGSVSLPGLEINLKERCVDVQSTIALGEGWLELVACTTDSKEHESVIAVKAKAAHIHAALLLIGATKGNPAMRKPINEERTRWVDIPPRGGEIEVSVIVPKPDGGKQEYPISRFIRRSVDDYDPATEEKPVPFPTSTFLFAGSVIYTPPNGEPRYVADDSGNVISLATFGDELLCLPGVHSKDNGALVWEVDPTKIPKVGTEVILRLKPVPPPVEEGGDAPEASDE